MFEPSVVHVALQRNLLDLLLERSADLVLPAKPEYLLQMLANRPDAAAAQWSTDGVALALAELQVSAPYAVRVEHGILAYLNPSALSWFRSLVVSSGGSPAPKSNGLTLPTSNGGGLQTPVGSTLEPSTWRPSKNVELPNDVMEFEDNDLIASFADMFNPSTPAPDRKLFLNDVDILRNRLASRLRGLLNPHSPYMQMWDIIVIFALFVTCAFTPFEVALLPTKVNASFAFAQFINLIFIVDLIFTFYLPTEGANGEAITSRKLIAIKYLRGWFVVDVISCIPFEILSIAFEDTVDPKLLKPIKMLRLLRLLKLMRIVRASRIFTRWENRITMSFTAKSLLIWTVSLLFYIHWCACGWAFLAMLMGSQRTPELQAQVRIEIASNAGVGCTACADMSTHLCPSDCLTSCELSVLATMRATSRENVLNEETWICRAANPYYGFIPLSATYRRYSTADVEGYSTADAFKIWMIPLSKNGIVLPANITERLVSFVLQFASLFIWSCFTGVVCGAIANVDPFVKDFRVTKDRVNIFLEENQAPNDLRLRVREYVNKSKGLAAKNAFVTMIAKLSRKLRNETSSACASKVLMSVPWICKLETECVAELAQHLVYLGVEKRGSLTKEEVRGTLFIVVAGVAAIAGKILTAGAYFGEDMIMTSDRLIAIQPVMAMAYLELASLSRDALDKVLKQFPKSAAALRTSAMLRAVQRVAVMIEKFNERKLRKMRSRGIGPGPDQVAVTDEDLLTIFKAATGNKKIRTIATNPVPGQKHVMVDPDPSDRDDESEQGRAIRDVSNRLSATEITLRELVQSQAKIMDALKIRDSSKRFPFFSIGGLEA